jgi:hypothetical protein
MQHLLQSCRVFSAWISSPEAKAFEDEELIRGALLAKRLISPTEQRDPESDSRVAKRAWEDLASDAAMISEDGHRQRQPSNSSAPAMQTRVADSSEDEAGDAVQTAQLSQLKYLQSQPPTKLTKRKKKQWLHDSFDESLGRPSCRYCGAVIVSKNVSIRKAHLLNIRVCR